MIHTTSEPSSKERRLISQCRGVLIVTLCVVPGQSTAYFCPPGQYYGPYANQLNECYACPAKSYCLGFDIFTFCPAGYYWGPNYIFQGTGCIICPSGKVCPGNDHWTLCSAFPGTYIQNGNCVRCPAGTYCPGDDKSYACYAGDYQVIVQINKA